MNKKEDIKVFIVDDTAYIRIGIRNILLDNGFINNNIEEAIDGVDALKKCVKFKPDITILDLNLPKIHGSNLIGLLLSTHSEMKILICSCIEDTEVYKDALSKGAVDWLQKPVNEEKVMKKIEKLVKTSSSISTDEINDLTRQVHDYSEKISVKLDLGKNLQILYLYGKFGKDEFTDLKESISSLQLYKYNNVFLNLNGVTQFEIPPEEIGQLKNEIERNKGIFKIILIKEDLKKMLTGPLSGYNMAKTEAHAIKEI